MTDARIGHHEGLTTPLFFIGMDHRQVDEPAREVPAAPKAIDFSDAYRPRSPLSRRKSEVP